MNSPILEAQGTPSREESPALPIFLPLPSTTIHTLPGRGEQEKARSSVLPSTQAEPPLKKPKRSIREHCSCDVLRGLRTSYNVLQRSVIGLVCSPFEIVYHTVRVVGCPFEFCYYTACGEFDEHNVDEPIVESYTAAGATEATTKA